MSHYSIYPALMQGLGSLQGDAAHLMQQGSLRSSETVLHSELIHLSKKPPSSFLGKSIGFMIGKNLWTELSIASVPDCASFLQDCPSL